MGRNILVVEDDRNISDLIQMYLVKEGFDVRIAGDGGKAIEEFQKEVPDLILLDINLPYQDGFQVCRAIRQKSNVPIIILTSRATDFDELLGLNIGADDFITKPYNGQVLLARIQKVLARTYEVQANTLLVHEGLTLNLLRATISHEGKELDLTKNELGILLLLMLNKGNIIPRDAIIDELWQSEAFIDENTLNVNIVRLRKKLAEIGLPDYLVTKRGMGYYV